MATRNIIQTPNSSSPASESMQVFQYSSGGRTRGVVNIAAPGTSGTKAYSFTNTAETVPTAATDGYANFRGQKNLHVVVLNTTAGADAVIKLWGYHTFSGVWGILTSPPAYNPGMSSQLSITVQPGAGGAVYAVIPIEGIERIYVTCTEHDASGTIDVYLGVNTF